MRVRPRLTEAQLQRPRHERIVFPLAISLRGGYFGAVLAATENAVGPPQVDWVCREARLPQFGRMRKFGRDGWSEGNVKRIIILVLGLFMLLASGCAKEKTDITEDLVSYLVLCPAGIGACYQTCATTYDANGNGVVDPSEQPNYNSCTGLCDGKCSTAFLLTLTN